MKKLDNFTNCLTILANADFKMAESNEIYRTELIGQFNLTFELAWKALQEIMRMHSVNGADTGSLREILQLGYKIGFINDYHQFFCISIDTSAFFVLCVGICVK